MKTINRLFLLTVSAAALAWPAPAEARTKVLREDVVVEKTRSLTDDVVTEKSITVDGVLTGSAVSLGGPYITVNGTVTGEVIAFGGRIFVNGTVSGDVMALGGPVEVAGKVTGDIVSMGGDVTLTKTANVTGTISSVGGTVKKEDGAKHTGDVTALDAKAVRNIGSRAAKMAGLAEVSKRDIVPFVAGGLIGAGIALLFSMLLAALISLLIPAIFFPANVESAAAGIKGDFLRSAGIGALVLIGLFPALLMLTVSIIGIPLVPLAGLLFFAACVLGVSAFSVVLQERFFQGINRKGPSGLPGRVFFGFLLVAVLLLAGDIIPVLGGLLTLIALLLLSLGAVTGLGAVFTTRMGTRPAPVTQPAAAPQQPAAPQPAPQPEPPAGNQP